MSKNKNTGLLIALGAVIGAAAAGISYYLKYKSYNDKIENEDFHDYEEEEAEDPSFDEPLSFNESNRTYITIDGGKGKSEETADKPELSDDAETADDTADPKQEDDAANDEKNDDTVNNTEDTNDSEAATVADTANDADITENDSAPASSAATVEEDTEGVN